MAFKKGKAKTGGRKRGSQNKVTGTVREMLTGFLEDNFTAVAASFAKLKPRDKVKAYTELLPYTVPKLQSVSSNITFENLESLTDTQLDQIIEGLKNQKNDGQAE